MTDTQPPSLPPTYASQPPTIVDPQPRRSLGWVPITVLALVVVAIGAFAIISIVGQHHDINKLQGQLASQTSTINVLQSKVSSLDTKITDTNSEISAQGSTISDLQTQIGALNTPTDPLSAYDSVCHQQVTNEATGVLQTYYFPCTNQAIPAPSTNG